MDTFKEKVRTRITVLALLVVGVALLYVGFLFYRPHLPVLSSFAKGFHQGVFLGLELVVIGFLVRNVKALKSEETIKKMYMKKTMNEAAKSCRTPLRSERRSLSSALVSPRSSRAL